jgi:hypothetical protein
MSENLSVLMLATIAVAVLDFHCRCCCSSAHKSSPFHFPFSSAYSRVVGNDRMFHVGGGSSLSITGVTMQNGNRGVRMLQMVR